MPPTRLRIIGPAQLGGTTQAGGSKNATLPIMAAALLADEPMEIIGAPRLSDVGTMGRLLDALGLRAVRRGDALRLQPMDDTAVAAPEQLVRRMRASFCVLGPLAARRGRAVVPLPGGCRIGDRPVDLHLRGLAALGVQVRLQRGAIVATARRLVGAVVDLSGPRGPTVTGTANVLCAATLAEGRSVLRGAAREPEIVDLCRCLQAMGARIAGAGTAQLVVDGVRRLQGVRHRVLGDRIEAATLLLAGAISGGEVLVRGAEAEHLSAVIELLRRAGCAVEPAGDGLVVQRRGRLLPLEFAAEPYPGVPTDVQAQFMALATLADGRSRIADRVFPARFQHVAELRRLGAQIAAHGGEAVVDGVPRLSGAALRATDLRASAALVLAALAAEGASTLSAAAHLDRGYEGLDAKLRQLGARIEREKAIADGVA